MAELNTGIDLGLALVLLIAAVAKARNLQALETMLVEVMPRTLWSHARLSSRSVARVVIAVELVVATALLGRWPTHNAAAGISAVLFCSLFGVALRAFRHRAPCACFGSTATTAGSVAVVRAGGLASVALATLVLTAGSSSGPTVGWSAVFTAACVLLWAMWPEARSRASTFISEQAGSMASSRRSFLKAAAITTAGLLVGVGSAGANPPQPPRTCQAQYNLCYGCDPEQNDCCIGCYVTCQLGGACVPGYSCGGCWPGP